FCGCRDVGGASLYRRFVEDRQVLTAERTKPGSRLKRRLPTVEGRGARSIRDELTEQPVAESDDVGRRLLAPLLGLAQDKVKVAAEAHPLEPIPLQRADKMLHARREVTVHSHERVVHDVTRSPVVPATARCAPARNAGRSGHPECGRKPPRTAGCTSLTGISAPTRSS